MSYRWLADGDEWKQMTRDLGGAFRVALRGTGALTGDLVIKPGVWPDPTMTRE